MIIAAARVSGWDYGDSPSSGGAERESQKAKGKSQKAKVKSRTRKIICPEAGNYGIAMQHPRR
jgi:hypothetical protein